MGSQEDLDELKRLITDENVLSSTQREKLESKQSNKAEEDEKNYKDKPALKVFDNETQLIMDSNDL